MRFIHGSGGLLKFQAINQDWEDGPATIWAYVVEYWLTEPEILEGCQKLTAQPIANILRKLFVIPFAASLPKNHVVVKRLVNLSTRRGYGYMRNELKLRRNFPDQILTDAEIEDIDKNIKNYM